MDPDRARALLTREKERVQRSLAALEEHEGADELATVDQHPADVATELFDEELASGMRDRLREELEAIERAERRLEEGTYGRSLEPPKPIPGSRLEAIPWSERTAEEQERYERQR